MEQKVGVKSGAAPRAAAGKTRASPASKARLSSVANSLRLLKAFSDDDYEIGISGLAQRLGLAKSTVHRLASTLIDAGMLEQNPETGRYRLGLALLELGLMVRRKMDVTNEARPYLRMLRETTGETVHLAILDHTSVLYVTKLESKQAIRMSSEVGSRAPVHCTGDGKALLAFQSDDVIEQLINHGLPALTPHTITNPDALRRDLAAIRSRGYAIDDEESEVGLRSVAAPIRSHSSSVVASLSIAGPAHRLSKRTLLAHARELVSAAEAVSQRLGYRRGRNIQE